MTLNAAPKNILLQKKKKITAQRQVCSNSKKKNNIKKGKKLKKIKLTNIAVSSVQIYGGSCECINLVKIKRVKDKIFYFFRETGYSKNIPAPIIFAIIYNVIIVYFVWEGHSKVFGFMDFIANIFFLMCVFIFLSLYIQLYDLYLYLKFRSLELLML